MLSEHAASLHVCVRVRQEVAIVQEQTAARFISIIKEKGHTLFYFIWARLRKYHCFSDCWMKVTMDVISLCVCVCVCV